MLLERLQRPIRGVRIVRKPTDPHRPQAIGAQIVPYRPLTNADVERVLEQLADVDAPVVTSALSPIEQPPFREAGFTDRESLYLFTHSLQDRPAKSDGPHSLRAGRRTDMAAVLDIDHRSFDNFWALDRDALTAARKATPVHRYRVATIDRNVVGYAVSGRSGRHTFLQRLGVDPDVRGQGIGTDLVRDALDWAVREDGTSMLVNTQTINTTAKRLYESLGFVLSDDQLVVLEWSKP